MKFKKFILPIVMALTLTGCDLIDAILGRSNGATSGPTESSVTISSVFKNSGLERLDSKGTQKILVIPVKITGTSYGSRPVTQSTATISDLEKVFFGSKEETGWESVSSYYETSSYGNLHITGDVYDEWYQCPYSYSSLEGLSDRNDATYNILEGAVEWIRTQSNVDGNGLSGNDYLKQFDQDHDGFIDSIFLVYSCIQNSDSDIYWAYTYWDTDQKASISKPNPYVYAWASANFTTEGGYSLPDAHTYIHETGHLLGLEDYYTYDSTGDYLATGGLDMMDLNIGDHDAYSKSTLGWTKPTNITVAGDYTLRPFESSGDCLVIRKGWCGSLFDEYLIIEFYTPTGLNQLDSETSYGSYPNLYLNMGIKVLHVDARLGRFTYNPTSDERNFVSFYTVNQNQYSQYDHVYYYTDVAASNTKSKSYSKKLIELVDAGVSSQSSNRLLKKNLNYANDTFLFHQGDTFGLNGGKYANYTFNNGETINFGFTVKSMTSSGAVLSFESLETVATEE